jgi:hypothetical protein
MTHLFIRTRVKALMSALAVALTTIMPAVAQEVTFASKEDLQKAADDLFAKADYLQAKPLYSQLLSQDPMNADYNYRYGACIMYTEADPTKPIPFLEGGASTSGVKPEANYFLGKSYHLNYRFDEAIEAYEKFKKANTKVTGVDVDINREIQMCVNGRVLYAAERAIKAEEKDAIMAEFYRPYDFRKLKGKVVPTPPNFKTKYDQKNLLNTVVYAPTITETLFYASYGEDGAYGKDIFKVRRLPNGEWGTPVRLPNTVNTGFDEDFAFFHEPKSTLYFSSKGHNTMGGYDIFASVYDAATDNWGVPTNLQYPINSPYDDFLYVTDPEETAAFLTTTRNSDLGHVKVLRSKIGDPALMDLTVIKGRYDDQTDAETNLMQATVTDPETKTVVGLYTTNKRTGDYVMVLPPKNDYSLSIAPKGKSAGTFDLDVPLHTDVNALRQKAEFSANGENGSIVLTSYFTGGGTKDSVVQRHSMSGPMVSDIVQSKVELSATELAQAKIDQKANAAKDAETKAQQEAARKADEATRKALAEAREKARQDSLVVVKKEQDRLAELAAVEAKVRADSIARVEQLAQVRQKAVRDSLARAREMEAAMFKARQDSIARVETARLQREKELAFKRQQEISDSLKQVQMAQIARQRAIEDSLATVRAQKEADEKARLAAAQKEEEARKAAEAERQKAEALTKEEAAARETAAELKRRAAEEMAKAEAEQRAEEERKAAEAKRQAEETARVEAEKKAAELKEAETIKAQAEAMARLEAERLQIEAEQEAMLAREREKAKADSAAAAEALKNDPVVRATNEMEKEWAKEDSISKVEEKAKAELEMAAAARQRAYDDSLALEREGERMMAERMESEARAAAAAQEAKKDTEPVQTAEERLAAQRKVFESAAMEHAKAATDADQQAEGEARAKAVADSVAQVRAAEKAKAEQIMAEAKVREEQAKAEVEAKKAQAEMLAKQRAEEERLAAEQQAAEEREAASNRISAADLKRRAAEEMAMAEAEMKKAEAERKAELERKAAEEAKTKAEAEAKRLQEEAEAQRKAEEERMLAEQMDAEAKAKEEALRALAVEERRMADAKAAAEEQRRADEQRNMAAAAMKEHQTRADEAAVAEKEAAMAEAARQEELRQAQDAIAKAEAIQRELDATHKEVAAQPTQTQSQQSDAQTGNANSADASEADIFKEMIAKLEAERKNIKKEEEKAKVAEPDVRKAIEAERAMKQEMARAQTEAPQVADATEPKAVEKAPMDPALQKSLEADRKAIEQQQVVARQKEMELAEKLAYDRNLMRGRSTEREHEHTLPEVATDQQTKAEKSDAQEVKAILEAEKATVAVAGPTATDGEAALEAKQPLEPIAMKTDEPEAVKKPNTADEKPSELSPAEAAQPVPAQKPAEPVAEAKPEPAPAVKATEPVAPAITHPAAERKEEVRTQPEPSIAPSRGPQPKELEYDEYGHLNMKAAKRHYGLHKVDYSHIKDRDIRMTVQMLAAQDQGKLSVLRSLRNRVISAQGDPKKLAELRLNERAMEVLASLARSRSREETVPGFDANTLRRRRNVSYRLNFAFAMPDFSDHVTGSLNAEAAATLAPAEFTVEAGSYETAQDARRIRHEMVDRGLKAPGINALVNGAPAEPSAVIGQPFIDN